MKFQKRCDAVHQQPHHPRRDPVPGNASAEIIASCEMQKPGLPGFFMSDVRPEG